MTQHCVCAAGARSPLTLCANSSRLQSRGYVLLCACTAWLTCAHAVLTRAAVLQVLHCLTSCEWPAQHADAMAVLRRLKHCATVLSCVLCDSTDCPATAFNPHGTTACSDCTHTQPCPPHDNQGTARLWPPFSLPITLCGVSPLKRSSAVCYAVPSFAPEACRVTDTCSGARDCCDGIDGSFTASSACYELLCRRGLYAPTCRFTAREDLVGVLRGVHDAITTLTHVENATIQAKFRKLMPPTPP